jgi:hypothetical protein
MNSQPTLLNWITCDGVHIDPSTGKHTLLGVFSSIGSNRFPITYPFMVWFLTVTNVSAGEHKLRISFGETPESVQPLLERPFVSQDLKHRVNLINEVSNLVFPKSADYAIVVEIDDQVVLKTSMPVMG